MFLDDLNMMGVKSELKPRKRHQTITNLDDIFQDNFDNTNKPKYNRKNRMTSFSK
jgi:hypothetical protein